MKATINGRPVIDSFTFVIPHNSEFFCHPFRDDEAFKLSIDVRLHGDISNTTQKMYIEPNVSTKTSTLVISSFYDGSELALANTAPIDFAVDDQGKKIGGNFYVRCLGSLETFTTLIICTVLGAE